MKDFTIKRTISGIIILAFFSSSFILPLSATAATGLNWNNPNQKNAFKLDASTLLNANNLMAVVGCTGIVDTATDAAMRLVSKVTSKVLNKLIGGGEVSVTDSKLASKQQISEKRQSCFDGLAYALAKQQLVSMTKSTMNWVNSGFNGDPMYVRNINSLTNSIEGTILQKEVDLFKNSPAGGGDYPYGRNFALSQISSFKFGQNPNNLLKQNLSNYLGGDGTGRYVESYTNNFSLGGWNGWLAFTQMPQNNPLGFNMIASQNLADKQNKEVTNTKAELSQNGGFLDQKKCVAYGISENKAADNSIKQQEQVVLANDANLLKKAQNSMQADCRKDLNGLNCAQSTDSYKQINNKYQTEADAYARKYSATDGAIQGQDIKDCTKFETVTPGGLIKDKVSKYLNSGETQLELADSLNEVLYSIFSNLISRFQQNGLSSLSSTSVVDFSTASTGIGANKIVDENGVSISGGNDGSGIDPSSNFDITTDLGGIITTQQKYIDTVNKLFPPLEEVMAKLGELDYCIPGPNPNWQENSTNAKDAYFAWLNSIAVVSSNSGFLGASNYTITIPDINAAASQNYINSINNNIKYWQELQSSWYFDLDWSGKMTNGTAANAQERVTNRINPRMDEVDKAEADYKTAADALYGFKSPMQTEYLNIGMPNQTENPQYLAMAQTGLSITRDINSYASSIGEMTTTYQNRIIETNSNIYKLKKLKEKIDIIVNRAQALRAKTRAENGLPPITKECLANEKTTLAQ